MQRNSVCKNEREYYTLEDIVDIETSDLVYVKLGDNIFCMEMDSYKNMIILSFGQRVKGNCKPPRPGRTLICKWYYPVLAAPLIFITEKSYKSRRKEIERGTNGRYYELINKKRIDFTTGLHMVGEKTGFDDVYDLVPSKFTVNENGNVLIPGSPVMPSGRGRGRGRGRRVQSYVHPSLIRRSPTPLPVPPPLPPVRRSASPRRSPPVIPITQRNYTVKRLKQVCKDKGIRGYSRMKKSELIRHCQVNDATSSTMTVKELRRLCKEKGVRGYSKMKKNELLRNCL